MPEYLRMTRKGRGYWNTTMNKVSNRKSLTKAEQADMLVLNLLQYLGPDPDTETFVEMLDEHQLGSRLESREALRRLIRRGAIETFEG